MSILALGNKGDHTFVHFLVEAKLARVDVLALELSEVVESGAWRLVANRDPGESYISDGRKFVYLDLVSGVYARPVSLAPESGIRAARWRSLLDGIASCLETYRMPVANRPGGHRHNTSKPLHEAWIASHGILVPKSITSSSRAALEEFAAHEPVMCKPCSGVRCNSFLVESADFATYVPAQGPVHLQRYIRGDDIRVHVVGDQTYSVLITGEDLVDYRSEANQKWPFTGQLPEELSERLVRATIEMGLLFAGWDLKRDLEGTYWGLECNMMPAYRTYDLVLEGAISAALRTALR